MSYMPAIDIDDIRLLAVDLYDSYKKLNHLELMQYALALINHALDYTNQKPTLIITNSINILKAYMKNEVSLKEVRAASLRCHAQARVTKTVIKKNVYRTIGQAIATAHVKLHAMRASDYMIKIVNLKHMGNLQAISKERRYQKALMDLIINQREV